MSVNWRELYFNKDMCSGKLENISDGDIVVSGTVKSNTPNPKIMFWAPNPPNHLTSYSGSALPFPNPEVAYDNSPNTGMVQATNRQFSFRLKYPNSYYAGLGTIYIAPLVNIKICEPGLENTYTTVEIDSGVPYRTLTYPSPPSNNPYSSPLFFHVPEKEVRTQEDILRSAAYPSVNEMPDNWWGMKPPC